MWLVVLNYLKLLSCVHFFISLIEIEVSENQRTSPLMAGRRVVGLVFILTSEVCHGYSSTVDLVGLVEQEIGPLGPTPAEIASFLFSLFKTHSLTSNGQRLQILLSLNP